MFGWTVEIVERFSVLEKAVAAASFKNLGHAAASLRKDVIASIRTSQTASPPGRPPHTRSGQLQAAILYAVAEDGESVVVGPSVEIAGKSGKAHEFGGRYKGGEYPKRAFMGPGFQRQLPRFAGHWAGTIGE